MNKHLNIFTTYTKKNRVYQLENDLTRALAICMQEDVLFFHEILKDMFVGTNFYNQLFEDIDSETDIQVEIQKKTSQINEFDHVFAVSLSESPLTDFWQQNRNNEYDPICDLTIRINNILVVMEAKRDNINCTAQLYNQIFNIYNSQNKDVSEHRSSITPYDLNWRKLMSIAVKVASFEKTTGNSNRFITDFVQLVKNHNFRWLPETPIGSLYAGNTSAIQRRIESALNQFCAENDFVDKLSYNGRMGSTFTKGWANELLFTIDKSTGDMIANIYPGNTKGQGYHIFHKTPEFATELTIGKQNYLVNKLFHLKFMGQSYITGLWLTEKDFKKPLHTKNNFNSYSGRKKRDKDWIVIEKLLDDHIRIDWRIKCEWQNKVINSRRTQFDVSFGYQISIRIPFQYMTGIDTHKDEIEPLTNLIDSVFKAFENDLVKK